MDVRSELEFKLRGTQLTVEDFTKKGIEIGDLLPMISNPRALNQFLTNSGLHEKKINNNAEALVPKKFENVWYEGSSIYDVCSDKERNMIDLNDVVLWKPRDIFIMKEGKPCSKEIGTALGEIPVSYHKYNRKGEKIENTGLYTPLSATILDYIMAFQELGVDKIPNEWNKLAGSGIKIFFPGTEYRSPRFEEDKYVRALRLIGYGSGAFIHVCETHMWIHDSLADNLYFAVIRN